MLPCGWDYTGSAGMPLPAEEVGENQGRRTLRNQASRIHRLLSPEEIENGKQARWLELEIHGQVRNLSKSIFDMRHLTAIFASHNFIAKIPPQISQLTSLTVLDLSHNRLTSLPSEIGDMSTLIHLNLSHNQLTDLPAEIGKLFRLKVLSECRKQPALPNDLMMLVHGSSGTRKLLQHLLDSLATTTPPPSAPSVAQREAQINVLCYNVLCDKYATTNLYSYCPTWALNWEYRKNAEVESEQFRVMFEPELRAHGYDGIFAPKSRAKTMVGDDRNHVDGCSLFWKRNKFKLVDQRLVEFAQIAIHKAHHHEAIINRVMPKDNIALLAMVETLPGIYRPKPQPPPVLNGQAAVVPAASNGDDEVPSVPSEDSVVGVPLILCAAHIHWDPEYCDVKLIQSMMMVHECARLIEDAAAKYSVPQEEVPLIICGDFNSLPDSGVIEYLRNGVIPKEHPDLKSFRSDMILDSFNTNEYTHNEFTHALKLESGVDPKVVMNTNITRSTASASLGPLDQRWLNENKILGFPHPHVPSDHIPIMSCYALRPVKHRSPSAPSARFRRRSQSFSKQMEKFRAASGQS
ncbi:Leucine-rich repeat and Endonuclease exonuclease phosphatase domain containing protein [Aphelenchoides fujianensis]|nr:Leucine-rich repeat and Endonuclease exonuclease phosphatase domain containing protein [Aphelenchoides fujianensis]